MSLVSPLADLPLSQTRRPIPELQLPPSSSSRAKLSQEPLLLPGGEEPTPQEHWVDGAAFFNNMKEQLNPPQCGRSSIVKIRKEQRGRVQDSVTKFSGAPTTPARPSAARRLSARMGTTPAVRLGARPSLAATPLGLPSGRRTTLTGIRTNTSRSYAAPTIASVARASEKSPLPAAFLPAAKARRKSPVAPPVQQQKQRRSPAPPSVPGLKKSPQPVYQNVRVERKGSNSRDIKRVPSRGEGERKEKKGRVRRNKSAAERSQRRLEREERRYLTIGCTEERRGEVRTPLRERQNQPLVAASPCSLVTRAGLHQQENRAGVGRKHSLRSDSLMSPMKVSNTARTWNLVGFFPFLLSLFPLSSCLVGPNLPTPGSLPPSLLPPSLLPPASFPPDSFLHLKLICSSPRLTCRAPWER